MPARPNVWDDRVGSVCESLSGHDKGTLLVVVAGLDESHVLVADGKRRTLIAPKKKKIQHIRILTKLGEGDTEHIREGSVSDAFLRKKLSALLPHVST